MERAATFWMAAVGLFLTGLIVLVYVPTALPVDQPLQVATIAGLLTVILSSRELGLHPSIRRVVGILGVIGFVLLVIGTIVGAEATH